MTKEEWAALIPLAGTDEKTVLVAESALEWLKTHTKLDFDAELPACAKLFILRFVELMQQGEGVVSESIAGMSQSFATGSKSRLLYRLARDLLGADMMKNNYNFIPRISPWV